MVTTLLLILGTAPRLVFWAPLAGDAVDKVTGALGEVQGGAELGKLGLGLMGKDGVLFYADRDSFALGGSITVSARVFVNRLPVGGTSPAGQIVFRGDDRCGLDNYSLNLGNDGYYTFGISSRDDQGHGVRGQAKVGRWQRVTGVFDSRAHEVRLYVDGVIVGQSGTPLMPVMEMEKAWSPGLSIGNVQNPLGGRHNQPFNGQISDVRIWDGVCTVGPEVETDD